MTARLLSWYLALQQLPADLPGGHAVEGLKHACENEKSVCERFSQIKIQLKRRYDLIRNP